MNEFKKCPNGHYYQGAYCPYCKNTVGSSSSSSATFADPASEGGSSATTHVYGSDSGEDRTGFAPGAFGATDDPKTTVVTGFDETDANNGERPTYTSRTEFVDEVDVETPEGTKKEKKARCTKKLVGWLVSYTLDSMGIDYKLYEGRNVIGRDMDCNITVNDSMVSGKHAVLLFRAGKYSITDQQSSNGTYVNGEDIELAPRYLNDGDKIGVGNTVFMFRTALF